MRYSGSNINLMVNDMQVNYTDLGPDEAPVIIFIHGFPLDMSMWNSQVEVLKDQFRVITYDIRGHGSSDTGNDPFSIDLFVDDLIRFMDVLKIAKASICGLSMGGYIALNAYEHYPERFEALVLCDTSCMADSPEAQEKRLKSIENVITNGVATYAVESIMNLFTKDSLTSEIVEINAVKKMILNTSELSLCSTLLALSARQETFSKLPKINVPVLILVGREDLITPPAVAEVMHKNIKDSFLQVLDHAGHLSNLENPGDFNQHLKMFLNMVYKEHLIINQTANHSGLRELRNKLNMLLSFRSI